MPGDPYKKVQAGQALKIPAETFNSFLDAAVAHKNSQNVAGGARDDQRSSSIVRIRNSSGANKSRGGILGIAGPVIGPSDNFDEFVQRVALDGVAPTLAHISRWAVLLEPLAVGVIGRAVVSGLAICQIVMRHWSHRYVEISATGQLESGDSGSAKIVWVAGISGTQWAVINIDSPRTLRAKFELIDDLEEATTAQAYLLFQDNLGNWRRLTGAGTFTVNAGDYSVENPPNDDRSGSSFTGIKFGGADGSNSGDTVEAVGWIEGTTIRWFAIGAGHKVVTGTNQVGLLKGDVGAVTVELQPVDTREIEIFAKALVDLNAGDPVIAWWNGPLRQWHMVKFIEYADGCGIVIDDETPDVAAEYADRGVRCLRIDERNVHRARSAGLQHTHSPLLCYLDADDILPPDYLERGVSLFATPNVGIVYSDVGMFGEIQQHVVDHIVATLPDGAAHATAVERIQQAGAEIVEGGPGVVWPRDFCPASREPDKDLFMFFSTMRLPQNGLLVLAAPFRHGDQLSRFRSDRGPAAVHHAAILVPDVRLAVRAWGQMGWAPLTESPAIDGELVQQFVTNSAGQIVEFIHRPRGGSSTFTCRNIETLRKSEVRNGATSKH